MRMFASTQKHFKRLLKTLKGTQKEQIYIYFYLKEKSNNNNNSNILFLSPPCDRPLWKGRNSPQAFAAAPVAAGTVPQPVGPRHVGDLRRSRPQRVENETQNSKKAKLKPRN